MSEIIIVHEQSKVCNKCTHPHIYVCVCYSEVKFNILGMYIYKHLNRDLYSIINDVNKAHKSPYLS